MHFTVAPRAGEERRRTVPVADEGEASRQADLAAMGVAAEHEVETEFRGFPVGRRSMRE